MEKPDLEQAKQKLTQAYEKMLHRTKTAYEDFNENTRPKIHEHIQEAKQKAVELGELTEEEAQQIADYLQRDLHDAAVYLVEFKQSLSDWLYFDWKLAESNLWKSFSKLADQTALELYEFKQQIRPKTEYKTGEVFGVGTVKCVDCEQLLHFRETSHIPPCPNCKGDSFVRASEEQAENGSE